MRKSRFTLNSATLIGLGSGIIAGMTLMHSGVRPGLIATLGVVCFVAASFFVRRGSEAE